MLLKNTLDCMFFSVVSHNIICEWLKSRGLAGFCVCIVQCCRFFGWTR